MSTLRLLSTSLKGFCIFYLCVLPFFYIFPLFSTSLKYSFYILSYFLPHWNIFGILPLFFNSLKYFLYFTFLWIIYTSFYLPLIFHLCIYLSHRIASHRIVSYNRIESNVLLPLVFHLTKMYQYLIFHLRTILLQPSSQFDLTKYWYFVFLVFVFHRSPSWWKSSRFHNYAFSTFFASWWSGYPLPVACTADRTSQLQNKGFIWKQLNKFLDPLPAHIIRDSHSQLVFASEIDLAIYLVWVSRWGKSGKATWGKKLLSRNLPKKYFNKLLKFFNKLLKFLNKLLKYLNKLLKYLISWKPICWLGLPSILGSRVLEFLGNVKIFSHLENSNWTTLRLLSRLLLIINYKELIHLRGCWGAGCCCWYRWVLFCNPASFSFSSFTSSFKL